MKGVWGRNSAPQEVVERRGLRSGSEQKKPGAIKVTRAKAGNLRADKTPFAGSPYHQLVGVKKQPVVRSDPRRAFA